MVPTLALPPVAPFTCQVTAVFLSNVTVAVNCCVPPAATKVLAGEMEIAACSVMLAEADTVELAVEVAVTVTCAGEGSVAGAVYNPSAVMVPAVELPPVAPLTAQVTGWVALNCSVALRSTVANDGEIESVAELLLPPPQPTPNNSSAERTSADVL